MLNQTPNRCLNVRENSFYQNKIVIDLLFDKLSYFIWSTFQTTEHILKRHSCELRCHIDVKQSNLFLKYNRLIKLNKIVCFMLFILLDRKIFHFLHNQICKILWKTLKISIAIDLQRGSGIHILNNFFRQKPIRLNKNFRIFSLLMNRYTSNRK